MIVYTSHLIRSVEAGITYLADAPHNRDREISLAWRIKDLSDHLGDSGLDELPADVAERVRRHRA